MTKWLRLEKLKGRLYEEYLPEERITAKTLLLDEKGGVLHSGNIEDDRKEGVVEISILHFNKTTPERHKTFKVSHDLHEKIETLKKEDINISFFPFMKIAVKLNQILELVKNKDAIEVYLFDPSLEGGEKYFMINPQRNFEKVLSYEVEPQKTHSEMVMIANFFGRGFTEIKRYKVSIENEDIKSEKISEFSLCFPTYIYHQVTGEQTVLKGKCGLISYDWKATVANIFIPPFNEKKTEYLAER